MKILFILLSSLSVVLLYGCTPIGENEESDSGSVVDSSDTVVKIIPEDGFYDSELVAFLIDDCEMEGNELLGVLEADHGFQFFRTGSKVTMHLIQRGEVDDESFPCELLGDAFTCHVMSESEDRGGQDHEAILIREMDVTIGWETNIGITGLLTFYRECIGADCEELLSDSCDLMPELPCETSLSVMGSKKE
jgi:hypothetical protein